MIRVIVFISVLVLLIACIGFFSSSETAYLSLTKLKMRQLAQNKLPHAKTALRLKDDMDRLLTLVLVGTNFINTLAASLATVLAVEIAGSSGVGIATAVITFCVTIFGQIIPKTAAVLHPSQTALRFAPVLLILGKIFSPVVWFFAQISRLASSVAEKIWKADSDVVTEEDIKMMIDVSEHEGTLEAGESRMLYKIFKFSDLYAHDIMKHRSLVSAVSVEADCGSVVRMFMASGCSRIPVYEGTPDTIIGILDYKSVLFGSDKDAESRDFVRRRMTPALFVPETFTVLEVLTRFKKEHTDFAVVLDEQGCTAGIVTMDDVMRVVFGRMTDENATSDIEPESRITLAGKNEYVVPGDMKIEDVNAVLKLSLESEEFNTLGGWLLEKFGSLPSVGEAYVDGNVAYFVEDQARRRILSVRIKKGVDRVMVQNTAAKGTAV
ncbi:MAG TPA: HlyC/CorC family transporter [Treponema sp.]|nr:HlyC/CorC family transporter [Treponema sp.]